MDPDAILTAIRSLYDTPSEELSNHIQDLDTWLSSGGFLPFDWDPEAQEEPPAQTATTSITLQITYEPDKHDHPQDWDWRDILDVPHQHVKVLEVRDHDQDAPCC